MNLRKQSSAYVGMQSFLIEDVHPYVWQSGRKVASSRVAPQDELISLSQQQMYQAAGTGCFLRVAMSHARTNQKTGASSLLESDRILICTYTANAVTAWRPLAAKLSAWRIAIVKEECTYKSKNGRVGLARKQSYRQIPVPEEPASVSTLQRKDNERRKHGRQEDSLQDLSQ